MGFRQAITVCFRKYGDFTGRAVRAEFWYFALFYFLASIGADFIDMLLFPLMPPPMQQFASVIDIGPARVMFMLAMFVPVLAVTVRRLHDRDVSGWWILAPYLLMLASLWKGMGGVMPVSMGLGITSIIAWFLLIIWLAWPGQAGDNCFGAPPFHKKETVGRE